MVDDGQIAATLGPRADGHLADAPAAAGGDQAAGVKGKRKMREGEPASHSGGRIKILLVEDNPGDARLVRELLVDASAWKFELTHVEQLSDAIPRLSEGNFDVVLLDLSLPDAHGLSTVTQLKAMAPTIPIVVLSGLDDEALALQAVQGGAQDYLVKGSGDGNLIARSIRYAIERKRAEERLAYLAQYDPLTGLVNRSLFRECLGRALSRSDRHGRQLALMFLDLDRFKAINDTLGHDVGDMLLKAVAERLVGCVRKGDTVARLGGDEFTIILEGIARQQDVAIVAQKILNVMGRPFILVGHEIFVTVSIGIALYPPGADNADALIKNADIAMYRAKAQGRNNYQFYVPDMSDQPFARLALESSLHYALERNEFQVYYQPLADLSTAQVTSVEALVRWRHPDLGIIPPDRFIPLAEEGGLMVALGEWVLRTACAQMRTWQTAGLLKARLLVNLSLRQFRHRDLLDMLASVLRETGLSPQFLGLELTERCFSGDTQAAALRLGEIKSMGILVAVDDFGAGYSSLRNLAHLPLDLLKIDCSLIQEIGHDDTSLVTALITLAHNFNLRVVAEGVETEAQLRFLIQHQCDEMQGAYFSPPVTADDLTTWLESGPRLPLPATSQ